MQVKTRILSFVLALFLNTTVSANIAVPAGASFKLSPGAGVDLACGSVSVSGSLLLDNASLIGVKDFSVNSGGALSANNASFSMAGDFNGNGTVSTGNSSLIITDGCATTSSRLSGSLLIKNLTLQSSSGKNFALAANTTLTVSGVLNLVGTPDRPVSLSASVGARVVLLPGASIATNNGNITAPVERSDSITSVPVMGNFSYVLLVLLMGAITYLTNRKYQIFRDISK